MSCSVYPLVENTDHSACGIGFIAESSGSPSRRVITLALTALRRLGHRGAKGADDETGDGSGLMTDIPQQFFLELLREEANASLGAGEKLGIAMVFTSKGSAASLQSLVQTSATKLGMRYMGHRAVPVRTDVLGDMARTSMPLILQLFVACPVASSKSVEARLYLLRRRVERAMACEDTFFSSFSSQTIVYKGLLTPRQLERFFLDLGDERYVAKVALFHERFATNTLPSWHLAQPFRLLAHNGEINTIRGNRLWMRARERELRSDFWGADLADLLPITSSAASDSLSLDNVLEFLSLSGRSLHHGLMMMIPDPYQGFHGISQQLRDFFIYHENLMEPWDGPAALVFTDGRIVGAKLDRNALRPLRYTLTRDGLVIMASEAGVVDVDEGNLVHNRHLTSGELFSLPLDGSDPRSSFELKEEVASAAPYSDMVRNYDELRRGTTEEEFGDFALPPSGFDRRLRVAFGWHQEEVTRFLLPMTRSGREPLGSMGDDTPPAVLSDCDRRFYDFFKQAFAQVTNPPIDPIREALMTGLYKYLGTEDNLLSSAPGIQSAFRIEGPVLSPRETRSLQRAHDWFPHATIRCHVERSQDIEERIEEICERSADAVAEGHRIVFLSDENLSEEYLPLPMPLVTSAVHHDLIRRRCRSAVALVCIAGDVVSDHHVACLTAMGASAVYPYLAYELIREQFADRDDWPQLMANYRRALEKGLLKIMAKMGISTVSSYHGSMNLYALGISRRLLDRYFPSIDGRLGGIGLDFVRAACLERNRRAFGSPEPELLDLGQFRFRRRGEEHEFSPSAVRTIRELSDSGAGPDQARPSSSRQIRDLLELERPQPVPIEEVEPAENLLRRFGAGAISFGAVSDETHRILARGFNLVAGRSSSGEGGEPADRYAIGRRDQASNCHIKQVASGRFGVTTDYLAAARELQIKMAQGAKPGEGGQLPGHKVTFEIAAARATTPGVPLISPPPHHDIYSIEDLAQLIFDLKEVNPRCRVSVKLVAQPGIGTIACGVVKAGADVVLVSGGDGGTGASPLGSLKHTGFPWELALPETHQALTAGGLRSRARLRVDGGMKSGRDVVVAALLGAEEFDFGTAALIALGCVMARQCHMNTCPVGIATQDPELRKKFRGTPEQLASYLRAVAEQARHLLAQLGCRTLDAAVGRTDLLTLAAGAHAVVEERGLDLDGILNPGARHGLPLASDRSLAIAAARGRTSLDQEVLDEVYPTLLSHGQAVVARKVRNTDRAVGTRLSGEIAFLYGAGNFRGHLQLKLQGVAGQSLGAFLTDGIQLRLRGIANDYVGKGMSGGMISIRLPRGIRETGRAHTVIGNVALYGATSGTLLVAGRAGERFAVRNSGASAVVEGVGNHACEYMTQGTVLILGDIGWNLGAGMTGGMAYLLPATDSWQERLNSDYVRAEPLSSSDEDLVRRLLHEHVFHCGSVIGNDVLDEWDRRRAEFVRIVPLAQDIVDFKAIYNQRVAAQMGVLLNE
jgi:glutamate synthase (NADPH/NADH) large chain/glutamate synthase (ferredoxin)